MYDTTKSSCERREWGRIALVLAIATSCVTGIGAGSAQAHEFWLAPSNYRAGPRDTLEIRAYVGTGFRGELRPYATTRTLSFTMQGGRRRFDLARGVTNGEQRWAVVIPPDAGGQIVSFQSNYIALELPGEEFESYLVTEGLDAPLAARRRQGATAMPGRERYARCAKAWIQGSDPARATKPLGHPLEIVPLGNPDTPRPSVRVLYRGRPLAHALVRTWNHSLAHGGVPLDGAARDSVPPAGEVRTARDGTATLDVRLPGEWLVNVVHMVPSEVPREADWQSLWASFAFARSARPR